MSAFTKIMLSLPGFEALCRRLTRRHVRVFMYHRFHQDTDGGDGISASVFREQLRRIVTNHAVWTPEQQLRARAGEAIPGFCPVVITADDGYFDYYEVAYPVLREFGVPATLFVTTGFIDGKIWMSWDQIRYLGEHAPAVVVELMVSGRPVTLDYSSPEGRHAARHFLVNRSRFLPDAERHAVLSRLATKLQVAIPEQPPAAVRAVSWDQIREMHRHGQLFAPHTVNHPILTRITADQVDYEIKASGDHIAAILGDAGQVFSYPQGGPSDFDAEVSRRVVEAGFKASYLAYWGPEFEDDALQMPRYCPGECMTAFRWSLCGAEYIVNRLRRQLGLGIQLGEWYWDGMEPVSAECGTGET